MLERNQKNKDLMKVLEFRLQGRIAHPQDSYCKSEILFVMLHGSHAQADRKSAEVVKWLSMLDHTMEERG